MKKVKVSGFIFVILFVTYKSLKYSNEKDSGEILKNEKTLNVQQKKIMILNLKEKVFSKDNLKVLDADNLERDIIHLEKDELKTLASDRNINNEMKILVNKANHAKLSVLDFTKLQNLIRFNSVVHKVIIEKEFEEIENDQERI